MVSLHGLFTLMFVGLKLTGHIDWSWLWVLAPMWGFWLIAMPLIILFKVLDDL